MRNLFMQAFVWLTLVFSVPVFAAEWVYIVHQGDTLWDFSIKNLKNSEHWKDLQKINSIENPKKMQPGTRIRVPLAWVKSITVEAEVIAIHGSASLTLGDQRVQKVVIGTPIHLGDQLDVEAASTLSVKFADGSVATLHEGSSVHFNHLSQYGDSGMVDTRFHLERGRVDTRAIPAKGDGSRFEIKTPSAITAVRGTEFRTTVIASDNVSRIEVLKGKVAVKGRSTTRTIAAGYGTQVKPNNAPVAPRKLLAAPTLEAIPDVVRQQGWSLRWAGNKKAQSYRIELSESDDFNKLLWSRVTENPQSILPELPDGRYYARIRSIDHLSIEGLATVAELVLDRHPVPPFLLQPINGQVFRDELPVLRWTESADAVSYRLQISASEAFSDPLILDKTISRRASYSVEESLGIGRYYWRVASISDSQEQGPYSAVRYLQVAPIPAAPEIIISAKEEQISVSVATESEQQYQMQISESDKFDLLTVDRLAVQQELFFDRVTTLQYMRVRIIESDGFAGPWGATQLIYPPQDHFGLKIIGMAILGMLLF